MGCLPYSYYIELGQCLFYREYVVDFVHEIQNTKDDERSPNISVQARVF